jgi:hypothetical protein
MLSKGYNQIMTEETRKAVNEWISLNNDTPKQYAYMKSIDDTIMVELYALRMTNVYSMLFGEAEIAIDSMCSTYCRVQDLMKGVK